MSTIEVKIKNRVISSACSTGRNNSAVHKSLVVYNFKERPVSSYFANNRSFRKEFTLIKIINNKEIQIVKEVWIFY